MSTNLGLKFSLFPNLGQDLIPNKFHSVFDNIPSIPYSSSFDFQCPYLTFYFFVN